MTSFYDEIEIEDFDFDEKTRVYTYPCPCGDKFVITEGELADGDEIARCPSCSLMLRVIYDAEDFECLKQEGSALASENRAICV